AQAAPLVKPYYQTSPKRVDAMIAGLSGAANFESVTGRSNLAHARWTAFSIGMSMAVTLIITGSLFGLVTAIITRVRSQGGLL
ncbi:MAG: hypothetical protein OEZ02_08700, partial [Anaerolineae bacterium]|nr:hypothetical protein [Anaerolineae bacterium]